MADSAANRIHTAFALSSAAHLLGICVHHGEGFRATELSDVSSK